MVEVATVGGLGALPLSYTGGVFFLDYLLRDSNPTPSSRNRTFADRCLNRYTTASFQRISLKRMVVCAYTKRGPGCDERPCNPLREGADGVADGEEGGGALWGRTSPM